MKTFLKGLLGVLLAVGLFVFAFYRTPQERAFTKNLKLAQSGDANATLAVARSYQKGEGTKPNKEQALAWYEQAVTRGSAEAAWQLFQIYNKGELVTADPETSFSYLEIAAQSDYPAALYEMGNQYLQGQQVSHNPGQAYYWYMKAAAQNFAPAKAKVDALSTEDPALFEKLNHFMQAIQAAANNDAASQLEVGQAYRHGDPILQDNSAAFEWFKKAWENSQETLSQAAYELGDQFAKGEGVDQDVAQAADWFGKAAELKNPAAQYQLGTLAYTENPARFEDAFAWFSNAAAQGYAQAQYMTGFMLLQGQGTKPSVPLALHFFEQAAQQEDASAQYVLGQIYTKGLGVKRNTVKGRSWLEKAAANGNEAAQSLLAN